MTGPRMRFAAMLCVYLAWLGALGLLAMWSSRPPERKTPPAVVAPGEKAR